jgi:hypothetical protein
MHQCLGDLLIDWHQHPNIASFPPAVIYLPSSPSPPLQEKVVPFHRPIDYGLNKTVLCFHLL